MKSGINLDFVHYLLYCVGIETGNDTIKYQCDHCASYLGKQSLFIIE